ncbi:sensor histidine kinase [Enterococcus sp. BWB1-3]|uniref:sensor histidine kinase n=1 Tax=Enterococcus sp. BWB1-3 TaxID=2787713 RepID=UPI00192158D1|nr:sensor histidine kinase [Enterococcus sp. BWB1-3]MBL1229626.1 sensor histidine kinase [Enterococcus sp. BWB1-3]
MKKALSIKQIFSHANKLMLALAIVPLFISILLYSRQIFLYKNTVTNIQKANEIAAKVDEEVLEDMWDVVTGQTALNSYIGNSIVDELRADIHHIQENTSTNGERSILEVALRIIDSLENYQTKIFENLTQENSYEKNKEIMIQVESVTQLLSDILQEFVRIEINLASQKNNELAHSLVILSLAELGIVIVILYFVQRNRKFLDEKIQQPLDNVIVMSHELSKGHLGYRLELPDTPELSSLTESLNKMADDLTQLLEENVLKQYHLAQSEVRVLQAQITPHFVYNSLDAIVSLIEQKHYDEAKEMTFALSDFFRISLSKGKDWITVDTEIRHIKDYLIILKIRYGEMLSFEINVPEQLKDYEILKMILQPLIENAVYHGTKFIRRTGYIQVNVTETENDLIFTVSDNGIGMLPERLQKVQEELEKGIDSDFSTGYGLYNVNKRLLLYYGREAGIQVESQYRHGTVITVTVPKRQEDPPNV